MSNKALRKAAESHAQYLSGFYVSEDVSAVKAREIAATLRSLAAALAQPAETDAELQRSTGEPHVDGWPLYSGLPPPAASGEPADEIERLRADIALSMETAHRAQTMAAQLLNERAAIAAPPGWQPIETAPKDGTDIMLSNGAVVAEGHWLHVEGGIREHRDLEGRYIGQDEDEGYDGWIDWFGGMLPEPTHWMPLPAAPDAPQSHPQR